MSNAAHNNRPNRESLSKRLGRVARQIKARDGHACTYCGGTQESTGAHLHLDHLTCRSVGGADVATNLVLACRSCNSARKDMPLAAWCRQVGTGITSTQVRAQARRALSASVS